RPESRANTNLKTTQTSQIGSRVNRPVRKNFCSLTMRGSVHLAHEPEADVVEAGIGIHAVGLVALRGLGAVAPAQATDEVFLAAARAIEQPFARISLGSPQSGRAG